MIKNLLQEGFALKNRGHYKHAIEVFYKALEEDNNSTELLMEIAKLYYKMKNEEKALSYIEQILNKNPEHTEALKLLKQIFIDKNALAEAEQTAKNIYCISRNKDDLVEIFKLLNIQGKYDEIFEYNIEEPDSRIYLEQAKASYNKKELHKSEEILKKALELAPDNQEILLTLGQVYYAQNRKDECIALLNKLSEYNENPELLNFCGVVESYQGNYRAAKDFILKAIKLSPQNDGYYFNLANIYFKQGDTVFAKQYYNRAIALKPDNRNYHFALANLYYSEKHYKRALEELQDDFFEANLLKAIILYDTGYLVLARQELKQLSNEQPDNPILLDYQERIDSELGINS